MRGSEKKKHDMQRAEIRHYMTRINSQSPYITYSLTDLCSLKMGRKDIKMKLDAHGLGIGTKIQHVRDNGPHAREDRRYIRRRGEVVKLSRYIFAVRFNGKKYMEWFPYTLLECREREWVRIRKG